jgi:hypothetical protein
MTIRYIYDEFDSVTGIFILVLLSALAKPSFILVLLPVLIVYAIIERLFVHEIKIKKIIFIIFMIVLVLAFQYLATYSGSIDLAAKNKTILKFAPFVFVDVLWENSHSMFLSLLGSFMFLLAVLIFFGRDVIENKYTRFALIIGIIGCSIPFSFAEFLSNGGLYKSGNFFWSLQISLFITTVSFIKFLLDKVMSWEVLDMKIRLKVLAVVIIFLCHVVSGMIWHWQVLNYVSKLS